MTTAPVDVWEHLASIHALSAEFGDDAATDAMSRAERAAYRGHDDVAAYLLAAASCYCSVAACGAVAPDAEPDRVELIAVLAARFADAAIACEGAAHRIVVWRERRHTAKWVACALLLVVATIGALWAFATPAGATVVEYRTVRASTYGWPGDAPTQPLAGCGYRKIGGADAGRPMPCRLSPRLPIVAHRSWRLGTLVRVCTTGPERRCAGARVGDRCGPGCDRNGVDVDLSWGVARRIGFGYGVADVIVIREVAR